MVKDSNEEFDMESFHGKDMHLEIMKYERTFDKTVAILRSSMLKLVSIIENIGDSWIIHEILMRHKNLSHDQIDLLLKQKKKLLAYNIS